MKHPILAIAALPLMLAACEMPDMAATGPDAIPGGDLPEGVLEIVAPNQDLTTARVDEVSGCYVYQYRGPVETTFLPLRATNGQPICARAPEVAAAAG